MTKNEIIELLHPDTSKVAIEKLRMAGVSELDIKKKIDDACIIACEAIESSDHDENDDWIPCSVFKPEDVLPWNKKVDNPVINVLVSTTHSVTKVQRIGWKKGDKYEWIWGRITGSTVIAWRPLPERYKVKKNVS